jgi:hypothetical protein
MKREKGGRANGEEKMRKYRIGDTRKMITLKGETVTGRQGQRREKERKNGYETEREHSCEGTERGCSCPVT